jgi:hypothetical protein
VTKGIFSDRLVNFKTCVRPLSFGSFYLKGATIFGFVKSMRPNKDTLFKNSFTNSLLVYTLLTIFAALSVPYYPANNTAIASNHFTLLDPFTTGGDICNDGIDNDGDGFVEGLDH